MNYIVFDLEFNQGYSFKKQKKKVINPQCPFEIIQLGAVKLDKNLKTVDTFNRLIKPEIYTKMHPYVKEITGITMNKLKHAKNFKDTYKDFISFIKENPILCVWGTSDIRELLRNVEYHKLSKMPIPKEYINIQLHTSKHLNLSKGINIGLRNAVESLNIPIESEFHDAFNDAYYTAEVFKKIFTKEIKPKIYNFNDDTKTGKNNKTHRLDTYKLIKQFEKMFNREMTSEEQSIIKLAYTMGKTNQFQVEIPNKSKK